jgi:hypothetical protein
LRIGKTVNAHSIVGIEPEGKVQFEVGRRILGERVLTKLLEKQSMKAVH